MSHVEVNFGMSSIKYVTVSTTGIPVAYKSVNTENFAQCDIVSYGCVCMHSLNGLKVHSAVIFIIYCLNQQIHL